MVEQDCRSHTTYRICERHKKDTKFTDAPWPQVLSLLLMVIASSTANPLPAEEVGMLQVRELQFSKQLENPCRLSSSGAATALRNTSDQERREMRCSLLRELKGRVSLLNNTAATILRNYTLKDCSILPQPLVARIPFADDVLNDKPLDVLREFYASLLNHTAHVYFISEQLSRYSGQSCYNDSLHRAANSLSSNMLELMCILRFSMLTLHEEDVLQDDIFNDLTTQLLNEPLMDLPVCARRQWRDCTTVYSTVTLLSEMTSYLRDKGKQRASYGHYLRPEPIPAARGKQRAFPRHFLRPEPIPAARGSKEPPTGPTSDQKQTASLMHYSYYNRYRLLGTDTGCSGEAKSLPLALPPARTDTGCLGESKSLHHTLLRLQPISAARGSKEHPPGPTSGQNRYRLLGEAKSLHTRTIPCTKLLGTTSGQNRYRLLGEAKSLPRHYLRPEPIPAARGSKEPPRHYLRQNRYRLLGEAKSLPRAYPPDDTSRAPYHSVWTKAPASPARDRYRLWGTRASPRHYLRPEPIPAARGSKEPPTGTTSGQNRYRLLWEAKSLPRALPPARTDTGCSGEANSLPHALPSPNRYQLLRKQRSSPGHYLRPEPIPAARGRKEPPLKVRSIIPPVEGVHVKCASLFRRCLR
ncbi:hypothetical protein JTE90_022052 [Oedothorax gibbosus]|uniref:Uncharacterized protein n=1 Tax=Oedothorax gibbosus TaxID=931172 RepID=A0AAV6V0S0_9ARAC|nr:hypothetical protein JTE90_022052 [Oedothorax gibbosus]